MNLILLIVRLFLAAVFGVASIAKLADQSGARQSLVGFGVPEFLSRLLALLLPLAEMACALALIPNSSAWWAASGVVTLLILFIAGIVVSMARGTNHECHCFGQLHSSPVGWKTLTRNLVFLGMAAMVVWHGPDIPGGSALSGFSGLGSFAEVALVAAGAIVLLTAFVLWLTFHLLRQNGRLLMRLEALEARIGSAEAAPLVPQGLAVNSKAPNFSLQNLDGEIVTLNLLQSAERPVLLLFSEPGCEACDALLPEVGLWQRESVSRLLIAVISRGDKKVNRAVSARHSLQNVLLQNDKETLRAYRVTGTPSGVLIANDQIASPLSLGAEAIRNLVVQATLPPPVAKGDHVPFVQLPDLEGNIIDLAMLQGRRTLLLFWNPSCGFCQEILPDVKKWERNPPKGAPELLVISTGSSEANREQGFRSRVLIDQSFGIGEIFGAGGTPSVVLLDEDGRVASDVEVGSLAVLAMAGVTQPRGDYPS